MLVLSLRKDSEITIGDRIRIKIIGTSGARCRLGVEAPRELQIDRPNDERQRDHRRRKETS